MARRMDEGMEGKWTMDGWMTGGWRDGWKMDSRLCKDGQRMDAGEEHGHGWVEREDGQSKGGRLMMDDGRMERKVADGGMEGGWTIDG